MLDSKQRTSFRKRARDEKPDWRKAMGLHPDFPLFPHQNGRWAKKVKGKLSYFGKVADDPKGERAILKWNADKDALIAGLTPRSKAGGLTLRDLCNKFLASKRTDVEIGKLSPRTFVEYRRTAVLLVDTFGGDRLVLDLRPEDFEKLYKKLAAKHGMTTLGREVIMCRSVFKYGFESDLIEKPVKFGPRFVAPGKADRRKHKARRQHANGKKMFQAAEIRRMIRNAGPQLRAMIYLGINAGLGNSDCATLPLSALDLKGGWLDFPRKKTGIERRVPLWPETVRAIKKAVAVRKKPRDPKHANLVFLTRLGQPWVRYRMTETKTDDGKVEVAGAADDAIATATIALLKKLGIYRPMVTFYALRHTFETIAGGCRDQVAVDAIMGHVDGTMAAEYREELPADSRLLAAVNHVRDWLGQRKAG